MSQWTYMEIMDIYGNKLVSTKETKPLCISLSNLGDMLTMVRGWTLLILEVKGQGHSKFPLTASKSFFLYSYIIKKL